MGNAFELQKLLPYRNDKAFLTELRSVKRQNKVRLGNYIADTMGIAVDPDSIFDIQVKRIHAYKRQVLAAFKVMQLYNLLKENPKADIPPYTFIFAGKAAAGYAFAKESIKYICSIADLVNSDPVASKKLRVVFLENFNVSSAQLIYPAADISEQISTAGKEASGTGCMKFMYNGAVTLGTLDGANVEIKKQVGDENIAIFGLTSDEVLRYRDELIKYMNERHEAVRREIRKGKMDDALQERIKLHLDHFKKFYLEEHPRKSDEDEQTVPDENAAGTEA